MTLVELVIAMAILSISVVAFVSAFRFISRSIHISRSRTLASNLVQEKIENMKDVSYHKLLLSTVTFTDNNFDPPIEYDQNNYAPETIVIGGLTFKRTTFVSFAEVTDNVISTITFNYPDPGMKMLRVYTLWEEKGRWKKLLLENIYENPDIDPLNTLIKGAVAMQGGGDLASAIIEVIGTSWKDTADEFGDFAISVHAGTYTVRATSTSFIAESKFLVGASTGTTTVLDFELTRIATGTVTGNVWKSTGLVISQIVASTVTRVGGAGTPVWDVEYVELFNPTTFPIDVSVGGWHNMEDKNINLYWYDEDIGVGQDWPDDRFQWIHIGTHVPPGGYYLYANASFFHILGEWIHADAYNPNGNDVFPNNEAGSINLVYVPNGHSLDSVGWRDNDSNPPRYEGTSIPDSTCADGPGVGTQMVRISSPPHASNTYGRAYDSNNNINDFFYFDDALHCAGCACSNYFLYAPHNSSSTLQPIISGKPMFSALVTADDSIGPTTTAEQLTVSSGGKNIPYAHFELTGVATGTWNVLVSTGTEYVIFQDVNVASLDYSTGVPNGSTSPPWDAAGVISARLSSSSVEGYISGIVQDIHNTPLGGVLLSVAGQPKTTGTNGRYFAQVSSGLITIAANEGNDNYQYVEDIKQVTINSGRISVQDFSLSEGGVIKGFITTDGSSILPGVEVTATREGAQYGSGTSDASGYFYIKNLGTATYTVQPGLDTSEVSTPNTSTVTVVVNDTVFVGTFMIVGSLGEIAGTVKYNDELVTSGALILASTDPISNIPPLIVGSSAPAQTFIYAASSKADGTYSMEVRGSADPYYLSAYIPFITTTGSVATTTKTYSGISVTASQTTQKLIEVP